MVKAEPELLLVIKDMLQPHKQFSLELKELRKDRIESISSYLATDLCIAHNKTEILNNKIAAMWSASN